jgi:hypothetical protein
MPEPFEEDTGLIAAYLDGTAAPDQRAELERRLPAEPGLADRLTLQARLSAMLETLGRQESHRAGFAAGTSRNWIAAAAVLAAALLGGVLLLRPSRGPDLRIASAAPGVVVARGTERIAALPAMSLIAGDTVRSEAGQPFVLEYAGEPTRLEAEGGAEVAIPERGRGKEIRLRAGEVTATVAPQPAGAPFVLATPHARIEVLGTTITVRVIPAATRLEVREGRARMGNVEVAAGYYAEAEKGRVSGPHPLTGGLKGEYFDNEDFTKPVMTRIDPRVDFTWGLGSPHPSMGSDYFSVRWTGRVEPESSGTWSFHVVSDDGARLWVDGRLIIDDWKVRGTEERTGSIELESGRKAEIRLEYFDCVSMAQAHLSWSGPDRRKELIPPDRLIPAP